MRLKKGEIVSEVDVVECESLTDEPVAVGVRPREYPPCRDQQSGLYHNETLFRFPLPSRMRVYQRTLRPAQTRCGLRAYIGPLDRPSSWAAKSTTGLQLFSSGTGRAMCFRSARSERY